MSEPVVELQQIEWSTPDPASMSLGRNKRHDERNRMHALPAGAPPAGDVRHRNWGKKLFQDGIGACTCFAAAHYVNHAPHRVAMRPKPTLGNSTAFALYRRATFFDPWDGTWEPDDTGSSGQAACQALVEAGLAVGYEWAFGYDHGLGMIERAALMQGTWWTSDMFHPDSTGRVRPTGSDSGGHEYLWVGTEEYGRRPTGGSRRRRSWFLNSWQESSLRPWGKNGYFWMDEDDHRSLLARDGDLVRPRLA